MKKLIVLLGLITMTAIPYAHSADQYSIFPGKEISARPFLMVVDRLDETEKGTMRITKALSKGSNYIQGDTLQEYTIIREKSKDQRFMYNIATFKVIDTNIKNKELNEIPSLRIGDRIDFNNGIGGGWEQGVFKFGPQNMRYVIRRR